MQLDVHILLHSRVKMFLSDCFCFFFILASHRFSVSLLTGCDAQMFKNLALHFHLMSKFTRKIA